MKKTLLSLVACTALAASANAQGVLVYGSIGYSSHTDRPSTTVTGLPTVTNETKVGNFTFNPGVGYMINPNLAVGLQAAFSAGRTTYTMTPSTLTSNYTDRSFDLEIGPFVRWTTPINPYFYTFTQLELGYLMGKVRYNDAATPPATGLQEIDDTYNGFGVNLFPAAGINITPMMSLAINVGGLSYGRRTWDIGQPSGVTGVTSDNTQAAFDFNLGQEVNFIVQWTFGKTRRGGGNMRPMDDTRMDSDMDRDDNRRRRSRDMDDE